MVVISIVNGDYKPTYNWGVPPCRKCSPQILTGDLIRDFSTPFCGSHRPCLRPILGSSLADPAAVTDGCNGNHMFFQRNHIISMRFWIVRFYLPGAIFFLAARQAACFFCAGICRWDHQVGAQLQPNPPQTAETSEHVCQAAITAAMRFS